MRKLWHLWVALGALGCIGFIVRRLYQSPAEPIERVLLITIVCLWGIGVVLDEVNEALK